MKVVGDVRMTFTDNHWKEVPPAVDTADKVL